MAYDLGHYDPASDLAGSPFKSIGKKLKKVVKPVARTVGKAAGVASAVGIPGAGFVNAAVSSRVGKKVTATTKKAEAVKKAVAPPKVKPAPVVATPPKKIPGVLPFPGGVKTVPTSLAPPPSKSKGKKKPVKPSDMKRAGLTFKKRAKKGGGTETVAVNESGAVVSMPIPDSVLKRDNVAVDPGPPLPANAVQAIAPQIQPSGDWDGSGVATSATESAPGSAIQNPLVMAGAGLAALLLLKR